MFFVDAAHFVFGPFLCCLWSIALVFVRAVSGRQRFHVLGVWNAVTRHWVAVTNTTVVKTDTMGKLLRKIATQGLVGPITIVLDNAKYQRKTFSTKVAFRRNHPRIHRRFRGSDARKWTFVGMVSGTQS